MSIYEYDITLNTNSELKNVTIYFPRPVYENESVSGNELVSRNLHEENGRNLSLVDTENGKMFALRAKNFALELRLFPIAIMILQKKQMEKSLLKVQNRWTGYKEKKYRKLKIG